MQFTLSPESDVEILALANQTQVHPGTVLAAIMNRGFETVHVEARLYREIEVSMRPRAIEQPSPVTKRTFSEPHPQHWRKALRFESSLDAEIERDVAKSTPGTNQGVHDLPPVSSHTWEFGLDCPTWIQTDFIHNGLAHWYLTNKVPTQNGLAMPRSTPAGCAIPIEPTAQSIVDCLAEIQDAPWIDKGQFLQALMPAIRAVTHAQSPVKT